MWPCSRFTCSQKIRKSTFATFNFENDVIHDARRVICNKKLKLCCRFGGIGTGSILAKICEIA